MAKDKKIPKPLPFKPTLVTIAGGDGMPPEPHWRYYYDETEAQKRAHRHWAEIASALQGCRRPVRVQRSRNPAPGYLSHGIRRERAGCCRARRYPPGNAQKVGTYNPHFRAMRQLDETIEPHRPQKSAPSASVSTWTAAAVPPAFRGVAPAMERQRRAADPLFSQQQVVGPSGEGPPKLSDSQ